MSQVTALDAGRCILNLLVSNDRLQYSINYSKGDISDAIHNLYSSTLKLINNVVNIELRESRQFRLKYHHILSNDNVEEYLFHCLSAILSELINEENIQHSRYGPMVSELHGKLMSITSQIKVHITTIVCANAKVQQDVNRKKSFNSEENSSMAAQFVPVYYMPIQQLSTRLKKAQSLTSQAIIEHYKENVVDRAIISMLIEFDKSFALFELSFVCQANSDSAISKESAEMTMDVAILFAEAVQWAHGKGLLQYSAIGDCDIEMMVGIPRLSVLYGCRVINDGPLSESSLLRHHHHNDDADDDQLRLAPVFRGHFMELGRLRRQLNALNNIEIAYLCRLLLDKNDVVSSQSLSRLNDRKIDYDRPYPRVSGDIHSLFKLISSVSDQMQSEHASDYRYFMEVIYKLYKDEPDDLEPCDEIVDNAVEAISYETEESLSLEKEISLKSLWDHSHLKTSLHNVHGQVHSIKSRVRIIIDCNIQFNRPLWQDASSFPKCCHCGINFNLFRRGRHCRRCGYLFCNSCWGAKTAIPNMGIYTKVPVCVECEEFMRGTV